MPSVPIVESDISAAVPRLPVMDIAAELDRHLAAAARWDAVTAIVSAAPKSSHG